MTFAKELIRTVTVTSVALFLPLLAIGGASAFPLQPTSPSEIRIASSNTAEILSLSAGETISVSAFLHSWRTEKGSRILVEVVAPNRDAQAVCIPSLCKLDAWIDEEPVQLEACTDHPMGGFSLLTFKFDDSELLRRKLRSAQTFRIAVTLMAPGWNPQARIEDQVAHFSFRLIGFDEVRRTRNDTCDGDFFGF